MTPVRSTVTPSPRMVRTGPSFGAGRRYLPGRNFVDLVITRPAVGAGSCDAAGGDAGGGAWACQELAASAIPAHARGAGILDAIQIRIPFEAELSRRRHVADVRRCGDHRGTREIPFAAEAHTLLPVASERRDGALPLRQRVFALAEARSAPGLTNHRAGRSQHLGDRLAAEPLIGPFDEPAHAAGSRKHFELAHRVREPLGSRASDDERR